MFAPGQRFTWFFLGVVAMLSLGCRGTQPFNRFVRVTEEPDSQFPEVDVPNQRLATSRSRLSSEDVASLNESVGPSDRSTSSRSVRPSLASNRTTPAESKQAATTRSAPPTRNAAAKSSATRNKSASDLRQASSQTLADDHAALMEAFKDSSPEAQQALRRLMATTTRKAKSTEQPAGLEEAIQQRMSDLPSLPAATKTKAAVPARRLTDKPKPESSQATIANSADAEQQGNKTGSMVMPESLAAKSKDTSEKPTNTASPATSKPPEGTADKTSSTDKSQTATIAQAAGTQAEEKDEAGKIQTTSATKHDEEVASVAQAAPTKTKEHITEQAAKPADMDDAALYKALLTRLAKTPVGESEAERASRMIKLRHLMVLSGDVDRAVEQIDGMSRSEQEFLRHQLLGLWTMVDPQGHPVPSRRITTALPQLREATKFAAAATDSLEVRSLAFCTEIESYGQIKTFAGNRFNPGQQVILYCEIENFTAKQVDGGFETHLQGSYDIYNEDNQKVVSQLLPADRQTSANYLRDYFIAYQMHLPKQLAAGTYRMQLTMEDVSGKKYGQASIPLEIAK